MKIIVIGGTRILYNTILKLREHIKLIITCDKSNDYDIRVEDFQKIATVLKIDFFKSDYLDEEIMNKIKSIDPDFGISANWRHAFGKDITDLFRFGIIEARFGEPSQYRGYDLPKWAITNGCNQIVMTLCLINNGPNSENILLRHVKGINENTYIQDVYDYFNEKTPVMFLQAVCGYQNGSINPQPKNSNPNGFRIFLLKRNLDSEIDWNRSSIEIARAIKASMYPHNAYTFLNGDKIIIHRARSENSIIKSRGLTGQVAERRENGEVAIVTGDGLIILEEIEFKQSRTKWPREYIMCLGARLGNLRGAKHRSVFKEIRKGCEMGQ